MSTSEPLLPLHTDIRLVCRCQDKDTSLVDARIALVRALGNLEMDRSSNLMEPRPEDKLTPVQARPNEEDGLRKARQCQETSIPLCI
ncbi:hypothetical protein ARMGADRAFT_1071020 [Armillaria gallica]|uniref:Uncharacterized protein n=1 Tax=Armillaria gallica TaxID=47427 RepID=A0A2H3EN55_ARMGA|nr:hypothetical protein ARMGADRAFT_1071020 [Armillaria gallica]